MATIQPLPTDVVQLITAGEVIDSLAAAVRELIENALDAQATRITISLWPDQWRLRVADNGWGMPLADLQRSALPHSTSKICHGDDLWHITSLGFRGEALHSLAQLAELAICSREQSASEAWQAQFDHHGTPTQITATAIAPGTIVTVNNLFSNWSTRRRSAPSPNQQLRAIQRTIQQFALCHPHLTWQVDQNDHPWFTLYPGSTAKQLLPQILRDVHSSDLQEHHQAVTLTGLESSPDPKPRDHAKATLYLLVGLPDRCHRHRPDWIKVAINGRCIHVPELEHTILAEFRRTLPRDRYPICWLQLQVPAQHIDWNRHHAKAEIYLQHLSQWQQQVQQAIETLLSTHLSPNNQRVRQLVRAAETQSNYQINQEKPLLAPIHETDPEAESPFAANHSLRALTQVHDRYILAEHPSGMWLVEQHIAHERVLYEQLGDQWQIIPLATPMMLHQLSPKQVAQLQRLSIEIEAFGDHLWAVRTVPALLAERSDCVDALVELSLGNSLEDALVATACRSAIRNGTPLSLSAMQTLLNQWQQTRHPHTCPHGRPIYLALEESALARFFRRHWVIGKSHGI